MHLIAPLAAGIEGCEGGTFSIVQRGTSTPANCYTDFEGLTAPIVGTNIALDSRGGGIFYVNELVKVTCRSSGGSTIREFVAGDAATAVEVRSDSFTGTHYQTGVVAASNPTTLASVLDRWNDSAGATNFQVLYGGAATNLSTVVSALSGQRQFVVTAYGAVGNGVANDQSAINAATAAANAAGGGVVYFPPGTYRVTGAITCYSTVALSGLDPNIVYISLDHATAQVISGTGPSAVIGLGFTVAQNHTGNYFNITGGPNTGTLFDRCIFNPSSRTVGTWLNDTWVAPQLYNCKMWLWSGDAGMALTIAGGIISGCEILAQSTTVGTMVSCSSIRCVGSNLSMAGVTSGTATMFTATGVGLVVSGCYLQGPTSLVPTFTMFNTASPAAVFESGNVITHAGAAGTYSSTHKIYNIGATPDTRVILGSRRSQVVNLGTALSNADPIVIPAAEAGTIVVQNNSTASHSGNVGINLELAAAGCDLELHIWNDTAGVITYQWGTNCVGTATFTVAANSVRSFRLVLVACPTLQWRIVSDSAGSEVAEG